MGKSRVASKLVLSKQAIALYCCAYYGANVRLRFMQSLVTAGVLVTAGIMRLVKFFFMQMCETFEACGQYLKLAWLVAWDHGKMQHNIQVNCLLRRSIGPGCGAMQI